MSSQQTQELAGVTLEGRYRLIRRMGRGGMGSVYEAERVLLPERYAIKVLHRHMAQDQRQRKRFLREAQAAYTIKHDHVVKIVDFGEQPRPYFVMEYLEGHDLKVLLKRQGKFDWARTRTIMLQVAAALEAAHALGIVHRDVKPSNVMVLDRPPAGAAYTGPDFVKVLDFGIAKVAESGLHVTRTDEMMGTARYMSPEQALATNVDPRSDVYALGIVMYELLAGRVPFNASSPFLIVDQHVKKTPPPPTTFEPSIPAPVEAIILKAIAKLPTDRFQGMDEFAAALRGISPYTSSPSISSSPSVPAFEQPTSNETYSSPGHRAPSLTPPMESSPSALTVTTGRPSSTPRRAPFWVIGLAVVAVVLTAAAVAIALTLNRAGSASPTETDATNVQ